MNSMKKVKRLMWAALICTMVYSTLAYYGFTWPWITGILAFITITFCEMAFLERDVLVNHKEKFGPSYLDSLVIVLTIISILFAFRSLWLDLLWIVISMAGGYLLAKYLVKKQKNIHA